MYRTCVHTTVGTTPPKVHDYRAAMECRTWVRRQKLRSEHQPQESWGPRQDQARGLDDGTEVFQQQSRPAQEEQGLYVKSTETSNSTRVRRGQASYFLVSFEQRPDWRSRGAGLETCCWFLWQGVGYRAARRPCAAYKHFKYPCLVPGDAGGRK
jgi:hypothetical protein